MKYWAEGEYEALITSAVFGASSTKKTPQVEIELDPLTWENEHGEMVDPPQLSRFPPKVYLFITDATMGTPTSPGWVAETLLYLGFGGNFDTIADDIVNKRIRVLCEYEDYNGKEKDRWTIQRGDRAPKAPAGKEVVRKANTLYGGLFRGNKLAASTAVPANAPASTTASAPVGKTVSDADDIPF